GRAGGKGDDHADADQHRHHAQHPAVHRPPPDADRRAIGAGEGVMRLGGHGGHAAPFAVWASFWTAARKASPGSSKSLNGSKEAQAGDRSTIWSPPALAASA